MKEHPKSKKLTLNEEFKQVYGEVLQPLGFKSVSRQPYFVRVIDDEILHVIALRKEAMMIKGKTDFSILSGVATVYRKTIDFSTNPGDNLIWLSPIISFIVRNKKYVRDNNCTVNKFRFENDNEQSMIDTLITSRKAVLEYVLPCLDQIKTLDSVVNYLYEFNIPLGIFYGNPNPDDDDFNEGLLQLKIDTAESLFLRKEKYGLARLEHMKSLINGNGVLKVKPERYALEERKFETEREQRHEKCVQIFSDTEWINNVLSVLEQHKRMNIEYLKSIGLIIA